MASKHILTSFLLVSSWVFVGYSQPSCVQKLLPCQAYLKAPSTPTAACCVPLKEMVSGDPKCLCDVFDNPDLLKSLNVTQDDAMKLAKACNVNADVSVCKKGFRDFFSFIFFSYLIRIQFTLIFFNGIN